MHDAAKRVNPDILVLCHGGPIAEPADAQYILDHTEGHRRLLRRQQHGAAAGRAGHRRPRPRLSPIAFGKEVKTRREWVAPLFKHDSDGLHAILHGDIQHPRRFMTRKHADFAVALLKGQAHLPDVVQALNPQGLSQIVCRNVVVQHVLRQQSPVLDDDVSMPFDQVTEPMPLTRQPREYPVGRNQRRAPPPWSPRSKHAP